MMSYQVDESKPNSYPNPNSSRLLSLKKKFNIIFISMQIERQKARTTQ